ERPEHESRPPSAPPGPVGRPAPRPVSGSSPAPMSARSHRGRRIAPVVLVGLVALAAGYALVWPVAPLRAVVALSGRIVPRFGPATRHDLVANDVVCAGA